MGIDWASYPCQDCYDELLKAPGQARGAGEVMAADLAELGSLSQLELHGFGDDLQLAIGELHGEVAGTWFPPPARMEEAA